MNECCQKAAHDARYATLLEIVEMMDKELSLGHFRTLARLRDSVDARRVVETESRFYRPQEREP